MLKNSASGVSVIFILFCCYILVQKFQQLPYYSMQQNITLFGSVI
ncbi:MAG TPA: hypothetical protein PLB63_05720 [Planctomycetota bacterium]|nr:hypothetical protein [Planctomycetota bacterium]